MTRALLWLLALTAVIAFVGLGRWQWGRAIEKEAMLAQRQAAMSAPPRALADELAETSAVLVAVAGEGEFLDVPPVLLDNQRHAGRVGVRVYRVFLPSGTVTPLLVDLGWLALPGDRRLPVTAPIAGRQALRGLLAPPPSAGIEMGEPLQRQPDGRWLALRLDLARIAVALELPDLGPRVLRLDPALPIGYPRDLDLLANTLSPEKHRGYAVQWWGLAAAVAAIALVLSLRRRHA
jgi:surfeit locus 1 family protein